jgi:eukaryotic-like serine/threonine-protein kinase
VLKETISHYHILRKLGAGGMGEVYLAEDAQLGRTVALKILPADAAHDRERMYRFLQEARTASALNHPNIAHIYEIGEFNGVSFIVMEYVEGQTLDAKINGRPIDASESIKIGVEIADALTEAHAKGITHRDIKPSNIIVTSRGGVKVLDFGLAKVAKVTGAEPQNVASDISTQIKTTPGTVMGTVLYMSPEQAMGREVDHRSDIFSLGTVLYEMITGRSPFSGKTMNEIIDRITHAQPEAIARFTYSISAELEHIIRKCLEKDRERRYQSAHELLIDLRNLQRDSNAGASKAAQSRRKRSRKSINSLAVLPFVNASAEPNAEYLSNGITESIINSLAQLPSLRVMARSTVFRYTGQEVDPQEVGRDLNVRAVLAGRVLRLGDRLIIKTELVDTTDGAQIWGEQYDRSPSDILAVQEEIAMKISEKLKIELTAHERRRVIKRYTENTEAYEAYLKGRYYWNKRTAEGFKKGIEYFQQAIGKDPRYALAYTGLADSYILLATYNFLPPIEAISKAKVAAMKALEIDGKLAEAHISLATIEGENEWNWSIAEKEFKRAIKINPSYVTAHQWYGEYLTVMGRFDEALAEIKRAHQLDPLSLAVNIALGDVSYYTRRYDEAVEQYGKTLEIDSNFAAAHSRLGSAYLQKAMYAEAIAEIEKARALSGGKPLIVAGLAYAFAVANEKDKARDLLDELKERSKQEYVSPYYLAMVYASLDEKNKAFKCLEKAYKERSSWMPRLKVEPKFDRLRSDPRFADLLRRVGLPPSAIEPAR